MAYVIPPNNTVPGTLTHSPVDHDNIADMLGLLTRAIAQIAGGGGSADPAGNAGNVAAVESFIGSGLLMAAPTAYPTVFRMTDSSYLVVPGAADDFAAIQNANNLLPTYLGYPSGKIRLINGAYAGSSTITNCPYTRFKGAGQGTILKYTGNGKAIYAQNTRHSDTETDYRLSGGFEDIVLDITGAGPAAAGIYLDSTQAYWLRCAVIGLATSATQAGVWVANDSHSLNSLYGYCHIQDCGLGLTFSTSGTGSASQERIDAKWKIQAQNGQTAVQVINGMQVQSSDIRMHINVDQYAVAGFSFGQTSGNNPSNFQDCHFAATRVEPLGTGAGNWVNPTVVAGKFANLNCGWKDCTGILFVSPSMPSSATAGPVGKVVWGGVLSNDAGLAAAQTAPNGWL